MRKKSHVQVPQPKNLYISKGRFHIIRFMDGLQRGGIPENRIAIPSFRVTSLKNRNDEIERNACLHFEFAGTAIIQ